MSGRASATVTILFTDLVASTELMTRLGEAEYDRLRRVHFGELRRTLRAHRGEEVKTTGDGLLATFGSAVEAVRAAVEMQQAAARRVPGVPADLALRVAVSLGEVVFEDGDVYGAPVVEAARLVARAEPREILVTALVRAVAGSRAEVRFGEARTLELKGLPAPASVSTIVWQPPISPVPPPALLTPAGYELPFVGREAETATLLRLWDDARAGERRLLLVAGEPGVGKTRLAVEVARRIGAAGGLVLGGRCDEGLGVPYQPFVEALRHYVAHSPPEALAAGLGRLAGELTRLVPEISGAVAHAPAPLRSDPETERYRLFDAVAAWLAELSRAQPVLLVLDDLQWAARPTLFLLRHVVRFPEPMGLLVLGTYRDTELGHDHPLPELLADFRRDAAARRVSLEGLDAAEVTALMEAAAGHVLGEEDRELAEAIHSETLGNPFFVGEVLQHLVETGAVYRRDERWARSLPVEDIGIPEGVREVVGRRLARLAAPTNRVLTVAAVAGDDFDVPVLRAAGGFEEEALLAALEETVSARLVEEAPWPAAGHRFTHALVRATIYESLSAARRRMLHRRVAEAIEEVHRQRLDDQLPALAHHFRLAAGEGDPAPAVHYATRAGDRALALLAHDEAVAYYRQALELLGPEGDAGQRCDLLVGLGEAQRRAGERAHRETLLEAAGLARGLGDAGRLAAAALANHRGFFSIANQVDEARVAVLEAALDALPPVDSARRARLLVTLAAELVFSSDHERRHRLAAEGLAMARRVGDLPTMGDVLTRGYVPIFTSLDVGALRRHTAELGRVAGELGDPALGFWASTWGFLTAVLVGDLEHAAGLIVRSDRTAQELGQPFLRWLSAFGRSHLSRIVGRLDEAETIAWEGFQLAQDAGLPDSFRMFGIQLYWIRYEQGRLDELLDALARAVARTPPPPLPAIAYCLALCELGRAAEARPIFESMAAGGFAVPFAWLFGATMLAEVAVALSDRERCRVLYDRLAPHSGVLATNGAATTGPVSHYLGRLSAALGWHDRAVAHFEEAIALEERGGAAVWLARSRLDCGRVLLARDGPGDRDRAAGLVRLGRDAARRLGVEGLERRAGERPISA